MDKNLEAALKNIWIIIRNAKLLGDEHDQLRSDFMLIRDALKPLAEEPDVPDKSDKTEEV